MNKILLLALLLFTGALVVSSRGGAPLFAQETALCNQSNTGAQCGTRRTCVAWRLSSGEISVKEVAVGLGATCASEVEVWLYKYVPPPFCMQCHGTPTSSGEGSGDGGSGGSDDDDCGDPDLWSDDGSNCRQDVS